VVGGLVALVETTRNFFADKITLSIETQNWIVAVADVAIALSSYILLYRFYEKRQVRELSAAGFGGNALAGFLSGLILQSLVIFVIYLAGGYSILRVNPVSFLIPGFIAAITAGFVAEILLRGILFRLMEEKLGTVITLIFFAVLFAILHAGNGATFFSVLSKASQAGILFSAVYVFSRSLWFPIFLHFAWDLAEPGIYGALNPGISIDKYLFTSRISGSAWLTGGEAGPGGSVQTSVFCLIAALLFLWGAKRKNNFISPYWKRRRSEQVS
jgi:hypothetical protein